jgi:hypothetical protein
MRLHGLMQGWLYFYMYVDYVSALEETYLRASTAWYGNSFALLFYSVEFYSSTNNFLCAAVSSECFIPFLILLWPSTFRSHQVLRKLVFCSQIYEMFSFEGAAS